MSTLVWRLHHRQVYFALVALAMLGGLLAVTGVVMANDYHRFFSSCGALQICSDAHNRLFRGDGAIIDLVDGTIIVPLLFGIFWGAPMVAKEFEEGTQNLVWAQGVTRRRWLTGNLAWVFSATVLWAGVMTLLVSWWRTPENALESRFTAFDIQGIAPIAYALFAVALGIAVGSVVRRLLPAIAVTLGLYAATRAVIALYVRPHYLAPIRKILPLSAGGDGGAPAGSWVLSSGLLGPGGHFYSGGIDINSMPAACLRQLPGKNFHLVGHCMASHGFQQLTTYQPAERFWAFQGIETAIFVVAIGGLLALTYRMVTSRDA